MDLEQVQLARRFGTQDALKDKLGLVPIVGILLIFPVGLWQCRRLNLVRLVHVVDGFGDADNRLVAVETAELLGVAPCQITIDTLITENKNLIRIRSF